MPRVNPWAWERPKRRIETREFRDPLQPDAPLIKITLRQPTIQELTAAALRSQEYIQNYVGHGPIPTPDFDRGGVPVEVDPPLCQTVSVLETMQQGPEEERYSFLDWVGFSVVFPNVWIALGEWATTLADFSRTDPEGDLGNPPAGGSSA